MALVDEADELGSAGRRLFDSLHDATDPYSLTVQVVEACRIKDRLDQLDRILSGEEELWLRLVTSRGDAEVLEIRCDSALQESRQLATVLRQLLAEIRRLKDANTAPDPDDGLADL
ncbi:terminase small subunit [Rhodococcus phage Mbo4]|uniref:Terminase small subunit n=2 Tax=root TaxID=1 RepID=A0A9E7IPR4_9CAUD|nr:hypothetical protein [Rhodococcus opacus]YP_010755906.1 terminase small subunit [Rhodococcus phage Mbo4]EKT83052.1 hypothetical protein WSS_A09052 [Rhodococcus opacus M213]URG17491.1 terminase small subunit [Rhodococcus phage Mbo4]